MEWSDPSNPNEGEAIIHLGGEYEGCWLSVGYENGLKNGKGVLYRSNHLIMLEVWYVRGICEGEMMERDDNGEMKLKYEMKNGVKSGYEYGYEGGEVVRIELFEEGELKWKSVMNTEMIGYWSVYGSKDELLCVCERSDDLKVKSGICYEYEGSELRRKCVYENDELKGILCEWKSNRMVMYREDGSRLYEGGYAYYTDGYVRDGYGKEYECDGNSVVYSGHWKNSKKNGYGSWYKNGVLRYNGEWRDNEPNGEGSLYDENGRFLCNGEWHDGVLIGGGEYIDFREIVDEKREEPVTKPTVEIYHVNNSIQSCVVLMDYMFGAFIAFICDSYVIAPGLNGKFYCTIIYCILSIPFLFLRCCWRFPIHFILIDIIFLVATLCVTLKNEIQWSNYILFSLFSFGSGYFCVICCFARCCDLCSTSDDCILMCVSYASVVVFTVVSIGLLYNDYYLWIRDSTLKNSYLTLGSYIMSCVGILVLNLIREKHSYSIHLLNSAFFYVFSILMVCLYSNWHPAAKYLSVVYIIARVLYWCYEYSKRGK